jgi:hypothetical protein
MTHPFRWLSLAVSIAALPMLACGSNGPAASSGAGGTGGAGATGLGGSGGTGGTGGGSESGRGGSGGGAAGNAGMAGGAGTGLVGAGGGGAGGGGAGRGGAGGGGGSAFAPVQAIFDQYCVRCHDPAHPFVVEAPTYIEMPLVASQSYAALVGVVAHETCGGTRVVAGDPEHSYLYRKVADATPCDGVRMPHGGMIVAQPLPDAQIATIHDWIANGAQP